jgi:hypothetical protein
MVTVAGAATCVYGRGVMMTGGGCGIVMVAGAGTCVYVYGRWVMVSGGGRVRRGGFSGFSGFSVGRGGPRVL